MEDLQAEKSPLHEPLAPLPLWPMTFAEATMMLKGLDQMTRYVIAGVLADLLDYKLPALNQAGFNTSAT